jgi:glutathione S-transferase
LGGTFAKGDFIAGEKLTIADFVVANVIFSEIFNEHLTGGHHYNCP